MVKVRFCVLFRFGVYKTILEEKEKDQQSLFKQIKSILTNTESYLQRYMWVIALVWILLSGFNWLIG